MKFNIRNIIPLRDTNKSFRGTRCTIKVGEFFSDPVRRGLSKVKRRRP